MFQCLIEHMLNLQDVKKLNAVIKEIFPEPFMTLETRLREIYFTTLKNKLNQKFAQILLEKSWQYCPESLESTILTHLIQSDDSSLKHTLHAIFLASKSELTFGLLNEYFPQHIDLAVACLANTTVKNDLLDKVLVVEKTLSPLMCYPLLFNPYLPLVKVTELLLKLFLTASKEDWLTLHIFFKKQESSTIFAEIQQDIVRRIVEVVQGRTELNDTLAMLLEAPSVTVNMHS